MNMTSVCTKTEAKTPNKISAEKPPHFENIATGAKNQNNNISEENLKHELIEETPYKMVFIWPNVIGFLIMHLGALYSVYLSFFQAKFPTSAFGFFLAYFTAISITVGVHRFYSHRSFKANKYIRCILAVIQTMTAQRSVITWVRDHRTHHKYTDTNADPHNSRRGFFFSHMGWLMVRKHPDVIRKGETIDVSDLERDPIVMFQKKHYLKIFFISSIILPTCIPCLLWNETVWNSFFISFVGRTTAIWNLTWLINSAAHMYGSRPYTKDISPVENHFLSLFTLGEGMHNYHHTFPWDYRGSEFINFSTRVIEFCMKRGWVYDAKTVSPELVKRQTMKKGDSSHPVYKILNLNGAPSPHSKTFL